MSHKSSLVSTFSFCCLMQYNVMISSIFLRFQTILLLEGKWDYISDKLKFTENVVIRASWLCLYVQLAISFSVEIARATLVYTAESVHRPGLSNV